MRQSGAVFVALLALCAACCCAAAPRHIVHIMADDLGFHNIGWRNDEMNTPNLDALAADGIKLDRHYTFIYCSPSRSSFLSGRLPYHVNQLNFATTYPDNKTTHYATVDTRMTTIAQKLKNKGYSTHQIGKWHVGVNTRHELPVARGFDTSFGYLNGAEDHFNQSFGSGHSSIVDLWRTDAPAYGENGTYNDISFTTEALHLIEKHDPSKPLFLYMAYQNPHCPLEVPDRYLNYSIPDVARRKYAGMVAALDQSVGLIVDALRNKGMYEDTLLSFTSDNGGPEFLISGGCPGEQGANNWPLKGGKVSAYEGGVRTVAFASGGVIPSKMRGKTLDGYFHIADWYRTYCSVAGISEAACEDHTPKGVPKLDSIDMWGYLNGSEAQSRREDMILELITYRVTSLPPLVGLGAAIVGDYKIVFGHQDPQALWTGPYFPNGTDTGYPSNASACLLEHGGCIFNIREDPTEHVNLVDNLPNFAIKLIQDKLLSYVTKHNETVFQSQHVGEFKKCQSLDEVAKEHHGFFAPYCT